MNNIKIEEDRVTFKYQDKNYTLKKQRAYPQIKVLLSQVYRQLLKQIEVNEKLNLKSTIFFLIDLYYLRTNKSLDVLQQRLLARLDKPVDRSTIIRLKVIYITIGHFLKKYRYL